MFEWYVEDALKELRAYGLDVEKPRDVVVDDSISYKSYHANYKPLLDIIGLDPDLVEYSNKDILHYYIEHEMMHKYQLDLFAGKAKQEYVGLIEDIEESFEFLEQLLDDSCDALNNILVYPRNRLDKNNAKDMVLVSLCREEIEEIYEKRKGQLDKLYEQADQCSDKKFNEQKNKILTEYVADIEECERTKKEEIDSYSDMIGERVEKVEAFPASDIGEPYSYFWMTYRAGFINDVKQIEDIIANIKEAYNESERIINNYNKLLHQYHNSVDDTKERVRNMLQKQKEELSSVAR